MFQNVCIFDFNETNKAYELQTLSAKVFRSGAETLDYTIFNFSSFAFMLVILLNNYHATTPVNRSNKSMNEKSCFIY